MSSGEMIRAIRDLRNRVSELETELEETKKSLEEVRAAPFAKGLLGKVLPRPKELGNRGRAAAAETG